jgi:hypothetical protein
MRRIARAAGYAALAVVVIGAVVYANRGNPIGPVAGRSLSGELVTTPVDDWSFTDDVSLIAVETRPAAPHSVTTICFTHEGVLYVPAQGASAKTWPHYAVSNPEARILVDGKIYPVRATRVTDEKLAPQLREAVVAKYDFVSGDDVPEDVWVFRIDSATPAVASDEGLGSGF